MPPGTYVASLGNRTSESSMMRVHFLRGLLQCLSIVDISATFWNRHDATRIPWTDRLSQPGPAAFTEGLGQLHQLITHTVGATPSPSLACEQRTDLPDAALTAPARPTTTRTRRPSHGQS